MPDQNETLAESTTPQESPAPAAAEAPASAPTPDAAAADAPKKKAAKKSPARKTAAKKTAAKKAAVADPADAPVADAPAADGTEPTAPKKKAAAKPKKKATAVPEALFQVPEAAASHDDAQETGKPAKKAARKTTKKSTAKKAAEKTAEKSEKTDQTDAANDAASDADKPKKKAAKKTAAEKPEPKDGADTNESGKDPQKNAEKKAGDGADDGNDAPKEADVESGEGHSEDESGEGSARRRPRRRGGRRRRGRGNGGGDNAEGNDNAEHEGDADGSDNGENHDGDSGEEGSSRRRRNRQRKPRNPEDEIASVNGSTRLEAKKQRRREGREAGRRRAPIVSEAEFLARRESVERVMVIRQRDDYTQIGVLEDKVLVEHYVARKSQTSLIGNVYLGRVQNVLPSMEAAFVDIGKGRNAVIYAGEVNWSALGHKDGQPRKIESVLSPGQTILVQVTKDPIGHKGARLSGQVSLPGRFLVYVPDGNTSGISRKLPDTERNRLKTLLKKIVPDSAGVIVRTAAEGASEEELTRDVERLTARWNDIEKKIEAGKSPELLYGEPDLTLKVVRDLFTEDFSRLVVQGEEAWDLVHDYVAHVAPDLEDRLERFEVNETGKDVFATFRVDEQIAKGLDRKVWLPSGGSLIIDRTEAMTVIDVNTGKFTGSGGNLEETVTKNNLEAAEEVVRQLRLRDIGGIVVIDFIDMVLESNRDLVLRRLVECLGRDRTRHQVAEVTSLGLVQMTRKRIGTGLVEAFSEDCSHCKGRGVVIHDHPMDHPSGVAEDEPRGRRGRGGRGANSGNNKGSRNDNNQGSQKSEQKPSQPPKPPSPAVLAATKPKPPEETEAPENTGAPVDAEDTEAKDTEPKRPETAEPRVDRAEDPQTEEPKAEEPAAPKAPTVVSTTRRRRTATRPAGPPKATVAANDVVPEADKPAEEVAAEQAPVVVVQPKAAGTTGATGQPTTPEAPTGAADATEAEVTDSTGDSEAPEDEQAILHVPVKRKGTRKR